MSENRLKSARSITARLIGTALLATPAILSAGNARAAVVWNWSFGGTEAGTFTTDGNFSDVTNNPFTFNITGFTVTNSTILANIGASYTEPEPIQGFIWNGSQPITFFRSNGTLTTGSNFVTATARYTFTAGSSSRVARLIDLSTLTDVIPFTNLTVSPQSPTAAVPEPSAVIGLLALGGLGTAFLRERKNTLQ